MVDSGSGVQQQRPDGTWGPAEVYPWTDQIDWEVYKPGAAGLWTAHAYRKSRHLATVHAKSRLGLGLKARWVGWRLRRRGR